MQGKLKKLAPHNGGAARVKFYDMPTDPDTESVRPDSLFLSCHESRKRDPDLWQDKRPLVHLQVMMR